MPWATLAVAGIQAFSGLQKGQQEASNYEAAAEADRYNAAIAAGRAKQAALQSGLSETEQRYRSDLAYGRQTAAEGESGFNPGTSASFVNADRQSLIFQELDALNVRFRGQSEVQGLQQQSALDRYQADVASKNASAARFGGFLGAAGSILGGVARYKGFGLGGGGSLADIGPGADEDY